MKVIVVPTNKVLDRAVILAEATIVVEGASDVRCLLVEKDGFKYLAFRKGGEIVAMRWEPPKPNQDDRGLREYY